MSQHLPIIQFPELIFGIAGPIGVDMETISDSLRNSLTNVEYNSEILRVTSVLSNYKSSIEKPDLDNYYDDIIYKMDHATELCRRYSDEALCARAVIREIQQIRERKTGDATKAIDRTAFIIRQLKRPEEVQLLRYVYGKQFILISAYGDYASRKAALEYKLRRAFSTDTQLSAISARADELIERDAMEEDSFGGQQLRETFHLGDVFIDGVQRAKMDAMLERFIQAFFGRTDCAPTKDEYGMYAAKSASLRSSDLSRQVGAAIFSESGEIITQGCNEVAKAFGGTYWDQEEPDFRDVKVGYDPNDDQRRELLRDLFERLLKSEMLSEKAKAIGTADKIVSALTRKQRLEDGTALNGALVGAAVMDLTEYGRVVHAEMCAICDAARLGRSVRGSTLYCTTFPCHNCSKHIIAAGIKNVVYIEPYPKSKTRDLYRNEIEIESQNDLRISFLPFIGISPFRYRDIFQKGKRKTSDGRAKRWVHDVKRPTVEVYVASYVQDLETAVLVPLVGDLQKNDTNPTHQDSSDPTSAASAAPTSGAGNAPT